MGWDEILAKWVFSGDDRNVKAVWVKGRLVSGNMNALSVGAGGEIIDQIS